MSFIDPPDRILRRLKSGEGLPARSPVATALVENGWDLDFNFDFRPGEG